MGCWRLNGRLGFLHVKVSPQPSADPLIAIYGGSWAITNTGTTGAARGPIVTAIIRAHRFAQTERRGRT